jgi:hypothetical protein
MNKLNIYKKLLDKGFERVTYINQEGQNVWYEIELTNENEEKLKKFIQLVGENLEYFDWRLDNIVLNIAIREDLSEAQYIIYEKKKEYGGDYFDDLNVNGFEQLLNYFEDISKIVE